MGRYRFQNGDGENICTTCNANDGQTYTLNELTALGLIPPLHKNCQCKIVAEDSSKQPTSREKSYKNHLEKQIRIQEDIAAGDNIQENGIPTKKQLEQILLEAYNSGNLEQVANELGDYLTKNSGEPRWESMTPEIEAMQERQEREWKESPYYGNERIDNALIYSKMSEKEKEALSEWVRYKLQDAYDEELKNAEAAALAELGSGGIAEVFGNAFSEVFSLGLTKLLMKHTDSDRYKKLELLKGNHKAAKSFGELAGLFVLAAAGYALAGTGGIAKAIVEGDVPADVVEGKGKVNISNPNDFFTNPKSLGDVTPDQYYKYFQDNGFNPQPLSQGNFKGIPFDQGGGFKINWGGDRILQYHPAGLNHHGGGAYWKISSGPTGTLRFDLSGNLLP